MMPHVASPFCITRSSTFEPCEILSHPQSDGKAAAKIEDAGSLFVDSEEVAKSETFQKKLEVISSLSDIDTS